MKKQIILITNSFPYAPGEEFLETELRYWMKRDDVQLTIIPTNKKSKCRVLDKSVRVDSYLLDNANRTKIYKNRMFLRVVFTKLFLKEVFLHNIFSMKKLRICISSLIQYRMYYNLLNSYFENRNNLKNTIIYTYWNNEITYALQTLKSKYGYKLVSRIHGGDLYQERRPMMYMPLKSQFTNHIDKLFTITQGANEYLHQTYGFNNATIELSRLGVEDHAIVTHPSKRGTLHIVSCSFMTEVKQLHKIIEALRILGNEEPLIKIRWTHLGGGILHDELYQLAHDTLESLSNIDYEFLGNLDNKQVYSYYKTNEVDVFINVSKSEGVPVSIMEAMSCHIPIVAPNIGGISDMLVDGFNGILLSSKVTIEEIVQALKIIHIYKDVTVRKNSYSLFLKKYNAEANYKSFVNKMIDL